MARGRPFKKGHAKIGGRRKGVGNKLPAAVKDLLENIYTEERMIDEFENLLRSRDPRVRLEVLKLALSYQYGKPAQPIVGDDALPPVKIDVSAIPSHREKA